jgi:hypothetical protein
MTPHNSRLKLFGSGASWISGSGIIILSGSHIFREEKQYLKFSRYKFYVYVYIHSSSNIFGK